MKLRKLTAILLIPALILLSMYIAPAASADAVEGDIIVILGEDLTAAQKEQVLADLDAPTDAMTIQVTNEEEHKYLGSHMSKAQIGSKALSSAKIVIGKPGSGVSATSNHINWVTNDMYLNAMITAGVKDAHVSITAPFDVSGTAALTGIIKAYETTTNTEIPEEQKQVANEEIVKTAQLSDSIGAEETTTLMTNIKEELAQNQPETREEMQTLIINIANNLNITIPEAQLNGLVDLFMNMKDANINWNAVGDQLEQAKQQFTDFIESEQGQGILAAIKDFFVGLIEIIKGWFS
ncbi:DUF1002 domain-containing protein [Paenibacillus urinalis]|uniref:DUF1002 domain-containing protein n=2 Tax=Paenibacillus TaxID=44249 RepID=A0ABY7XGQ2_9BACL|nr:MULTISPECIES: DUF1002 domain-containing protein [Paenibacillus]WDH99849.1 DUF1002 domain-containing protein [Paenibacillus urinalis]WDI04968.1 DUF1002 domain-containing protein [Paenibacillus urinalis]GAK42483.1 hypothetical protein TCA2_4975 [Paenibacillus sp. TCA20]